MTCGIEKTAGRRGNAPDHDTRRDPRMHTNRTRRSGSSVLDALAALSGLDKSLVPS